MSGENQFSKREKEVVALLVQGKSNKQMAMLLDITVRTVEFHLSNVYKKLKVASRTEAIIKLAEYHLRESTGAPGSDRMRESAVEMENETAENKGHLIPRRIPMKKIVYGVVGVLLVVVFITIFAFPRAPDYHSDEEIERAALKSAADNFDDTEMTIHSDDPVQIGTVVLNQFLRKFRQRETHYAIRLVSYTILEINFIGAANDLLYYTARVSALPQDKTRFVKIIEGVLPYEENEDEEILVSLKFTVFQAGETFKLVDIDSDT